MSTASASISEHWTKFSQSPKIHFTDLGNCRVRFFMQTDPRHAHGNLGPGGEQAEALGRPCPHGRASVKQGQVQDKATCTFQTTIAQILKKIKLFKQKINTNSVAELGIKPSKARKFKRAAAIPPSPLNRLECYTSQWDEIQGPAGSFMQNVTSL